MKTLKQVAVTAVLGLVAIGAGWIYYGSFTKALVGVGLFFLGYIAKQFNLGALLWEGLKKLADLIPSPTSKTTPVA